MRYVWKQNSWHSIFDTAPCNAVRLIVQKYGSVIAGQIPAQRCWLAVSTMNILKCIVSHFNSCSPEVTWTRWTNRSKPPSISQRCGTRRRSLPSWSRMERMWEQSTRTATMVGAVCDVTHACRSVLHHSKTHRPQWTCCCCFFFAVSLNEPSNAGLVILIGCCRQFYPPVRLKREGRKCRHTNKGPAHVYL